MTPEAYEKYMSQFSPVMQRIIVTNHKLSLVLNMPGGEDKLIITSQLITFFDTCIEYMEEGQSKEFIKGLFDGKAPEPVLSTPKITDPKLNKEFGKITSKDKTKNHH